MYAYLSIKYYLSFDTSSFVRVKPRSRNFARLFENKIRFAYKCTREDKNFGAREREREREREKESNVWMRMANLHL